MIIVFTIKSVSSEGIYYLVNHVNKYKTYWVEANELKPGMLFSRVSDAKSSLTKLLKVMSDYRTDTFYLVQINNIGNIIELEVIK